MPSMETENSNISRAEEVKVLANEAFKGSNVPAFCFLGYFHVCLCVYYYY